jgi:hypothetical protein
MCTYFSRTETLKSESGRNSKREHLFYVNKNPSQARRLQASDPITLQRILFKNGRQRRTIPIRPVTL